MKKKYYILCFLLFGALILTGCSSIAKEGRPIEDFEYIDQDGNPFGLKDLKGKVWMADLVFTNCTTVCPPMSSNMSQIQQQVIDAGLDDVHFVSFTVDPEVDTPEALKTYAEGYGADLSTWHFLTGYTQKEIEDWGPRNFKTAVKKPKNDPQGQVLHGVRFYLVNKNGEIVSDYSGDRDVPFDQIIKDIKSASKQ